MAQLVPLVQEGNTVAVTNRPTVQSDYVEKASIFDSLTPLAQTMIPLAKDAYQAKLGADIVGSEGSVNEVGIEGVDPRNPDAPDIQSFTTITEAFQQGLLSRTQAQLKVNQLVRQKSIDNPGYGSFFRRQAAKFFQQNPGGGGRSPFGGLSNTEQDANAVQRKIKMSIAERTGLNVDFLDPEDQQAAYKFHKDHIQDEVQHAQNQMRMEAEGWARSKMENTNYDTLRQRLAGLADRQQSQFLSALDRTDINSEEGREKLNAILQGFAAANELVIGGKVITTAQREELRGFNSWTNTFKDLVVNKEGLALKEQLQEERNLRISVETDKRLGGNAALRREMYEFMRAAPDFYKHLPLEVQEQTLDGFIRLQTGLAEMVNKGLTNLSAVDGTAGQVISNVAGLSLIKESLTSNDFSHTQRAGLGSDPEKLKNGFEGAYKQLNGDRVVEDDANPAQKAMAHLNTMGSVIELLNPENKEIFEIVKRQGTTGLQERVENDLVIPLLSAGRQLAGTIGEVEIENNIRVPLTQFLQTTWSEAHGVHMGISKEGMSLPKPELEKLESVIRTFNTKLSPQITKAADYKHKLLRIDNKAKMNSEEWGNWATKASKAMGLGETLSDIELQSSEGEFTREVVRKLERLEALEALGKGEPLARLKDLDTAANKTYKTVFVSRKEDGTLKSDEKNMSARRLARIRAKEARAGTLEKEPIGEITNPLAAVEYVRAAHPDLFTDIPYKYLDVVANKESSWDPNAQNPDSNATGLWQFMNTERVSTWDEMVERYGNKYGIKGDLRTDPVASTIMMAEFTNQQKRIVEAKLGREIGMGEMYLAHVLGAGGASDFLKHSDETPVSEVLGRLVISWNPGLFQNQTVGSVRRKFDNYFK